MKRLYLLIALMILVIPFNVFAAEPKVLTVTPEADGSTVKYSGTTEDGVSAVMCKLYNGDDEVDMLSTAVDNKAFTGSFEGVSEGNYTVFCARYEGGEVVSADVSVAKSEESKEEEKDNPKTFDAIGISVALLSTSALGLYGLKKKEN